MHRFLSIKNVAPRLKPNAQADAARKNSCPRVVKTSAVARNETEGRGTRLMVSGIEGSSSEAKADHEAYPRRSNLGFKFNRRVG